MSVRFEATVWLAMLAGAVAVVWAGCDGPPYSCYETVTCYGGGGAGGAGGEETDGGQPDAENDAGKSSTCSGVCLPLPPETLGWTPRPFLLWIGHGATPPMCPGNAPTAALTAYADPDPSFACPLCACDPPAGSCQLPATMIASAFACPGTVAGTPFDPPSGWDGSCTAQGAIGTGVQSLTIDPPVLNESGCMPAQPVVPNKVTWGTIAQTCEGTADGSCGAPDEICSPAAPTDPKGFLQCVSQHGDDIYTEMCPAGYPSRYVFYLDATDTRGCSPCTCGSPQGSACSTTVSLFADDACSTPLGSAAVTSAGPACIEVPSGSALGSKTATPPAYTSGTCQPGGGQQTGSVDLQGPVTICCH